jgi:hypothetical protein
MITVKATREGLIGKTTSTGFKIDSKMPFVALPSTMALYKFIHIHCIETDRRCIAIVLDVGPWNIKDHEYVFEGKRPMSESRKKVDSVGNVIEGDTNGAGIDLSEAVWAALGLPLKGGSTTVEWEFVNVFKISAAVEWQFVEPVKTTEEEPTSHPLGS